MTLRNWMLVGLGLCVFTILITLFRYPRVSLLDYPRYLALLTAALLWYGYAAIRRTSIKAPEDSLVLHYGALFGVAIGCAWTIEVVFANLVMPHELGAGIGFPAAVLAVLLPLVAGAVGAIKSGKVWTGVRVGFWSGAISGIIAFLVIATVGYILALLPGLPGAETPSGGRVFTGAELEQFRVLDALAAAVNHLLPVGAIYCTVAGAVGASIGLLLERTGRSTTAALPTR